MFNAGIIYSPGWNRMYLKDVLTREETEIFDTNDLLADSYAWQTHISTNEQDISFTLKRNSDYSTVGCAVYFCTIARSFYLMGQNIM